MSFSYLSHRKRFRIPWQAIVRPMLLASLGLHALILLFPLSSEQPTKPQTKSTEEKINLTQVPPKGAAAPQPRPQPSKSLPPLATRSTLPKVTARSVVRSQPVAPTRPAASPQPVPAQPKPQPTAVDPFAAAFPQYPGAQPGSYGLPTAFEPFSQKTTDAVDRVSNWFQSQFKSKGFQAQSVEQSGRTVYQVSKDGKSKFLTLIPNPQGAGTSIVLSDQLLPDDLGGGSVVSPQEQAFYQNLAEIIQDANPNSAWHDLDNPRILPDPNAFYAAVVNEQEYLAGGISQLQPGVERKVVHVGQSPEALFAQISTMMQTAEIQVTPQGTYGGGALYQLQRDGITRYLSLVPTQDGNTAIFIWTRAPK